MTSVDSKWIDTVITLSYRSITYPTESPFQDFQLSDWRVTSLKFQACYSRTGRHCSFSSVTCQNLCLIYWKLIFLFVMQPFHLRCYESISLKMMSGFHQVVQINLAYVVNVLELLSCLAYFQEQKNKDVRKLVNNIWSFQKIETFPWVKAIFPTLHAWRILSYTK